MMNRLQSYGMDVCGHFAWQAVAALSVLLAGAGVVEAGFCVALREAPSSASAGVPPNSVDDPNPSKELPNFLGTPPADANTTNGSSSPGLTFSTTLSALPADSFTLNHREPNGWYAEPGGLSVDHPMPSGIFHPPRG